ncbi:MAG: triacylglycerol lipase [Clostridiales bacterium]|nr:triacylglycerol lipase [Clostridiales bacterium]
MILSFLVFILFSNIALIVDVLDLFDYIVPIVAASSAVFIFFVCAPSFRPFPQKRTKKIQRGVVLLVGFLVTVITDAVALAAYWIVYCNILGVRDYWNEAVVTDIVIAIVAGNIIFWSGIIRVYISSKQLGLKWRLIGILCGMIPIAHLIALGKIISLTSREYKEEDARYKLNMSRAGDQVCMTKYPLLMVHGVFFRDFKFFNYWGRVPDDLVQNGATVYYGDQQSAASVDACGREIADKIKQIVETTGCGKVNIIAHSKGGLDSRCAITKYGCAPYVASLTTVNTPHRGCQFADYLLNKAPQKLKDTVSAQYNYALRKAGDKAPDFISAVSDLTSTACEKFNNECPDMAGVYYQSVGSKSVSASGGRFPLNLSYHLVNYFDGPNDGLVALPSMKWGENFKYVTPLKSRGITHGDMIDLNRENIDGFDVRETFVELVSNLKNRGL